jgi:protein tyrosine/serine phosphatase
MMPPNRAVGRRPRSGNRTETQALAVPPYLRWTFGIAIATLVSVVPVVHYRWEYTHAKRLREVVPGKLYRSGSMTADGFADALARYGFRTIINLQDEWPDPELSQSYFRWKKVHEKELCERLGVRYVYLPPDTISRRKVPQERPAAIDKFLEILADPGNYPILLHCRAGLHRTGVMTAVYRMEYDGWTPAQALRELKANGFGEFPATSANDYITQYILTYRRGRQAVAGQ